MSELERFKQTFFQECAELLGELEERFAEVQRGEVGDDAAQAVFRAVHSIEGGAGAFGFADLVSFAHVLETVLDDVRNGKKRFTPPVVEVCLRACDALADLVAGARDGTNARSPAVEQAQAALSALLSEGAGAGHAPAAAPDEFDDLDFTPVMAAPMAASSPGGVWRIGFRPHTALYDRANEPLYILRELAELGPMRTACDVSGLPALADYDPHGAYLAWSIELETGEGRERVEAPFDFVIGDCDLSLEQDGEAAPEPDEAPVELSMEALLAEARGAAPAPQAAPLPAAPSASPSAAAPEPGEPDAAAQRPAALASQTIRVDFDRVDRVADMTGELVIAQAMIYGQIDARLRSEYPDLVRGLDALAQHTRMLQDAIMAIRAQPVKAVFARVPRLIRELAAITGKKVRLETEGEATEIDRTVIEQLTDPLTHMIRNAVDHGLETPDVRRAAGKREEGLIRLSAEQSSGRIVIRIADDGAGINREKVLAKARARGLVAPDAVLTEEEIDQLIFLPGFSTAEALSDISGRGVGMDVVRENISRLGGRVTVKSSPGQGCTLTLSLPLTLAILDVMIVEVGGAPYVLPLANVIESLRYQDAQISRLPSGETLVNFRDRYASLFDLSQVFGSASASEDRYLVMCDTEGDGRLGFVVDAVLGQQQVAMKSLEANFGRVEGFAGATIMGDGRVALILDVAGLERMARKSQRPAKAA